MAKIKLYIATSIDGCIARSNGDIEWLLEYPITPKLNYEYDEFYESIGSVIMGGRTYHSIFSMDVKWPYSDKECYVITRNSSIRQSNINLINDDIVKRLQSLKEELSKDIWLVGGGEITSMLLNHDLIDEMIITTVPVVLGDGISLFSNSIKESRWSDTSCEAYENGVTQVKYKRL